MSSSIVTVDSQANSRTETKLHVYQFTIFSSKLVDDVIINQFGPGKYALESLYPRDKKE